MNRRYVPNTPPPPHPRRYGHSKPHYARTSDESSTSSKSSFSSFASSSSNSSSSSSSSSGKHTAWTPSPQKVHWRPNRRTVGFRGPRRVAPTMIKAAAALQPPMFIPPTSQFVALDCEMVGIGPGGYTSSAARVTIVDWEGQILMDQFIQQTQPVTDYRTFVSGITPEHLQDTAQTMSLEDCRTQVLQILQNRILVGHALANDLDVLGISSAQIPWWLIRDTAKYEPFMQLHYHTGVLCPRKLKHLAKEKLAMDIQMPGRPHSPYEDARAAMDLYKTVRPQWESFMKYQVDRAVLSNKQQQQQQMAAAARYNNNNYVLVQ